MQQAAVGLTASPSRQLMGPVWQCVLSQLDRQLRASECLHHVSVPEFVGPRCATILRRIWRASGYQVAGNRRSSSRSKEEEGEEEEEEEGNEEEVEAEEEAPDAGVPWLLEVWASAAGLPRSREEAVEVA